MAPAGVILVVLLWLAAGWAGTALTVRRDLPGRADGGDVALAVAFTLGGPATLAAAGVGEAAHALKGRTGIDWAKVGRIWGFR